MFERVRDLLVDLGKNNSGNAALMMAVSIPAIIGGSGVAVDVAQWYMWKRELQYAVDQAALAGAWARADSTTLETYQSRALQEYNANLQTVSDFDSTPTIRLTSYGTGTNNAVEVVASAGKRLPFSSFLTNATTTVRVSATAAMVAGKTYSGCLVAINPTMEGAFTLGGNASGSATCGVVALSTHVTAAMIKNGQSNAQLGSLVAGGGIDSDFSSNGTMIPNTSGLSDPYSGISEPNPSSSPARTYSCPTATTASSTTTATKQVTVKTSYIYVSGNNSNTALDNAAAKVTVAWATPKASSTDTGAAQTGVEVPTATTNGSSTTTGYTYVDKVQNSPKVHEVKVTETTTTYSNVTTTTTAASDGIARPLPGTYGSITITCQTIFQPGIYVVDTIDFGQNQVVTGEGVLFVIKTSNGMHINSQSNLNLSGITKDMLINTYGYSETVAAKMATMLVYDKDSTDQIKINGTSDIVFNGILYVPKREVWFNGTNATTGECVMVVANNITITGTTDFNSFCIPAGGTNLGVGGSNADVRLVS